jgi:hypothetical protein
MIEIERQLSSKAVIQSFRNIPAQQTALGQLRKFTPVAQFARKRSSGSRYRAKQVKIAERGDN